MGLSLEQKQAVVSEIVRHLPVGDFSWTATGRALVEAGLVKPDELEEAKAV